MLSSLEFRRILWRATWLLALGGGVVPALAAAVVEEPVNPFGAQRSERSSVRGAVYLSDGSVLTGDVWLTTGKRLRVFDAKKKTYTYYALRDLDRIEIEVVEERVEREWRFKESGSDEKVFTGRTYPRRDYRATLTPRGAKPLRFELADGLPVYLLTDAAPERAPAAAGGQAAKRARRQFLLQPYSKGEVGATLAELVYIRRIEFGETAAAAARKQAAAAPELKPKDRGDAGDAPGTSAKP